MGYMKFYIKHPIFDFKLEPVKFLLLLIILPFGISPLWGSSYSSIKLPPRECYTVFFHQKGVFQGQEEDYRGKLVKKGKNRLEVVYYTSPPFEVEVKGFKVSLGYRGEERETFDRREYKNPLLEVLLHLDHLGELFEIKPLGEGKYLLIPKGKLLSQYLERVILYTDRKGYPTRIELFGGAENYLVIGIEDIEPTCGGEIK